MVWYKKLLIFFGITIILGLAGGYWFVSKYDAIVKKVVITNLNKALTSEVNVQNVSFSVYSSFPYASLDFENVLIRENRIVIGTPDTLLFAKVIKLNFNLIDIYYGQYNIKRIVVEDGKSKISIDKSGVGNYNIIQAKSDSTDENFNLALDEILLKNIFIEYTDEKNSIYVDGTAKDLSAVGNFSNESFDLNLRGLLSNLLYNDNNLKNLKLANLKAFFGLTVNNATNSYFFKPSEIIVNDLHTLNLTGKVNPEGYNFKVDGHQIKPISFISIYNTNWASKLAEYEVGGAVDLTFNISQENEKKFKYNLFFKWFNGQFQLEENGAIVNNVFAKGLLKPNWKSDLEKGTIQVDSFRLPLKEGDIIGDLLIENLTTPKFTANTNCKFQFDGPFSLFNQDSTYNLYGNYEAQGKLVLPLWRWNFKDGDLQKILFKDFKVNGENITIPFSEEKEINISQFEAAFSNKKAVAKNLELVIDNTDILFDGEIINFWNYLWQTNQKLYVKGNVNSNNFIFADLDFSNDKADGKSTFFPQNIAASLNGTINHFEYGSFKADSTTGKFLVSPSLIKATDLEIKTMEGWLKTQLKLQPYSNEKMKFSANGNTSHLNIKELFKSFNNFNQTYIRDTHLEGFATSEFTASGIIDYSFQPDYKSLKAILDLSISNGILKGFEPLAEINEYFETQPVLKRLINTEEFGKRVEEIKFSDLKNTLKLENEKLSIPGIKVKSSVMDMALEGTHTFTNEINYSLSFNLRELMMKDKENSTEFGEIEDDGLGGKIIYLKISGTTEEFDIEWDKKKKREAKKVEFEKEKEVLKEILKEEFGNSNQEKTIEEKSFEIEWEEFKNEPDSSLNLPKQSDTSKKENKKKGIFKKLLENPKEKEKKPEIIFDDDF